MKLTKFIKAFKLSKAFKGDATKAHILSNLSQDDGDTAILQTMTRKQLAVVINVANRSYHDGKASTGAEIVDDCLWIGHGIDKLIPVAALKQIEINTHRETLERRHTNPLFNGSYTRTTTSYKLDFTEQS